jgi:DNA-binding winged helix-turn-helix (wHTH) protein
MRETGPNGTIRFGTFELNPQTGELRSKGSRVKLQDQPLQILLAVLKKPGNVVTREELRAKLWPADTFVDFDHGLNAAVTQQRRMRSDQKQPTRDPGGGACRSPARQL